MLIFSYIIFGSFIINLILALVMIFIERKKPNIIMAWMMLFTFLPIIGFIIYALVGSGLSYKTKKFIKKMKLQHKDYLEFVNAQKKIFSNKLKNNDYADLVLYNLNNSNSAYFDNNSVRVFLEGEEKIKALKRDLERAKSSINLLYYIFADDIVGNEIMEILVNKAKEGVKVKLLYDSIGCLRTRKSFFKRLTAASGEVAEFFPPLYGFKFLNFKANYRNHRKIAVIDGKIGYVGGINIRDDHMGRKKKLSPWRDTHIRISGEAVYGLQLAFFSDWRYCKNIKTNMSSLIAEGYFPNISCSGDIGAQIITSGPDYSNQPIKEAIIKMILSARERVYIQTPYFIPDELMIGALLTAKKSGVDVKIIIPSKPDKKFVYGVTLSYCKDLLPSGIDFFTYNGFIHSKMVVVDSKAVTIGTCNLDSRSFALNFEINAFLYGEAFAKLNAGYFLDDLNNSKRLTPLYFKRKPWINKVGQAFFRLFSPLL